MNEQDWSPFAGEPLSPPRPAPSPGRASVPPPSPATPPRPPHASPPRPTHATPPRPSAAGAPPPPPGPAAHPPHDQTAPLRPPGAAKSEHKNLIPAPDETAILPQIPDGAAPAPAGADSQTRKKQSVKRHRDAAAAGARKTVRGIGELLVTFGVVVLLYAAYEIFGVTAEINDNQEGLSDDLDIAWSTENDGDEAVDGAPIPELGDAFARMWAPDIRAESWTLVEGTELSDIEYAPGRYLDGAYPGEQGNFTLAGHNVPAIFSEIRSLEPGDKVVIETKENFYIYEVQEHVVVDETQVDITAPVPGDPSASPGDDDYWLTLFTCHPRWDNYQRYVVYSQLVDTVERDPDGDLPDEAIDPEV